MLFFDQPATLGRDFSVAVQAIGMTSASIFMMARRQPLAWAMLKGAILGSLLGTPLGIDLVLLCRADLKIAIPTSVVIMAFTSVVGIAFKNAFTGEQPGVFENWLAAAPVVGLGAPLGAFAADPIGRKPTLFFVAILCVAQFLWTCYAERVALGVVGILLAVCAVALALIGFERLRIWGRMLGHESPEPAPAFIAAPDQPHGGAAAAADAQEDRHAEPAVRAPGRPRTRA